MDDHQFDRIATLFGASTARRGALALLTALGTRWVAGGIATVDAKKKKRRKKKNKNKNRSQRCSAGLNDRCTSSSDCCGHTCCKRTNALDGICCTADSPRCFRWGEYGNENLACFEDE